MRYQKSIELFVRVVKMMKYSNGSKNRSEDGQFTTSWDGRIVRTNRFRQQTMGQQAARLDDGTKKEKKRKMIIGWEISVWRAWLLISQWRRFYLGIQHNQRRRSVFCDCGTTAMTCAVPKRHPCAACVICIDDEWWLPGDVVAVISSSNNMKAFIWDGKRDQENDIDHRVLCSAMSFFDVSTMPEKEYR